VEEQDRGPCLGARRRAMRIDLTLLAERRLGGRKGKTRAEELFGHLPARERPQGAGLGGKRDSVNDGSREQ
jgi:hypothetical protein